jgi:hypothetical protein
MGGRIAAAHRWCVTGTPVGPGGMHDVLGLLRALHAAPFDATPAAFQVTGGPTASARVRAGDAAVAALFRACWCCGS